MTIRDLTFFLAVCQKHSIRKAAKTLFITPQGLSKEIKKLEHELQTPLFYRNSSGIVVTDFGKVVKKYAEIILDNVSHMQTDLDRLKNTTYNQIPIACAYGVISALSPEYLLEYKQINPAVELNIHEYPDLLVENAVWEEKAAIGFTIGPVDENKFDAFLIKKHDLKLLVNQKNPLGRKKSIDFSDLENEKFILVNNKFKTHQNILNRCHAANYEPNICMSVSEISMAHKYCNLNYGIAVTVDYIIQDLQFDKIKALPFSDKTCTWDIYMIVKKDIYLSDIVKNFINNIKAQIIN